MTLGDIECNLVRTRDCKVLRADEEAAARRKRFTRRQTVLSCKVDPLFFRIRLVQDYGLVGGTVHTLPHRVQCRTCREAYGAGHCDISGGHDHPCLLSTGVLSFRHTFRKGGCDQW